jgi:hypothetical protein
MEFRTNFSIQPQRNSVTYNVPVITMGSCFSTMLGQRLAHGKMKVLSNPFGVIFNPLSLCELMLNTLQEKPLPHLGYLVSNDIHYHYQTHSTIYGRTREELTLKLNMIQKKVLNLMANSSHLFITWGSSYIYEKLPENLLVANCHKQPGSQFNKRLLSLDEMKYAFGKCYDEIIRVQPNIQIVLTVSPVRHTKDGIPQNQLSKSLLRVLCHELSQSYPQVSYFPSYEWMIDDLRDYRFYKSDLVHPSEMAEAYIWQEFQNAYFKTETKLMWEKINRIQTSLSHRTIHPESVAHKRFLRKLLQEMIELTPQVDFSLEIEEVTSQLATK